MTYHAKVRAAVPETCFEIDMMVNLVRSIQRETGHKDDGECQALHDALSNIEGDIDAIKSYLDPLREANRKLRDGWVDALKAQAALAEALESFLRAPSVGSAGPGSITIAVQDFNMRAARAALKLVKES